MELPTLGPTGEMQGTIFLDGTTFGIHGVTIKILNGCL